jgi:hypothetical protein
MENFDEIFAVLGMQILLPRERGPDGSRGSCSRIGAEK